METEVLSNTGTMTGQVIETDFRGEPTKIVSGPTVYVRDLWGVFVPEKQDDDK